MIKSNKGEVSIKGTKIELMADLAVIITALAQEGVISKLDVIATCATAFMVDNSTIMKIDVEELKKQMEGEN